MITVRFEAYRNKKVFTGIDKLTEEPVILNKLELEYKTEQYLDDNTDPEIVLDNFRETCIKQRYKDGEGLFFDTFKETDEGFVYGTHSQNFRYKTTLLGWTNKKEKIAKVYSVEHTKYDDENKIRTQTVYTFTDEDKVKTKVNELCPDYEWEPDDTYVGFPIMYCTQFGVMVNFDYHGIY